MNDLFPGQAVEQPHFVRKHKMGLSVICREILYTGFMTYFS